MRTTIVLSGLAGLASAAAPSINGLGSSYAAGPGLSQPIGKILANKLNARPDAATLYSFNNIAVDRSVLKDVQNKQAPQLADKNPAVVYLVSGGNDLSYVPCLGSPDDDVCKNPVVTHDEFVDRYTAALDAITNNTGHNTALRIYPVTYITAIGKNTVCGDGHNECPLHDDQKARVQAIYTDLIDWTQDAIHAWNTTSNNKDYKIHPIWMRGNSVGHDVNSSAPWINGATVPKDAGGVAWHPNNAGAEAVATYIYNDLTK